MEVQSLSVCIPGGCPNHCKFCVSHMHRDKYYNSIEKNQESKQLYKADFKTRMMFARDNGCNTMILTGDAEPLFNRQFLERVLEWNSFLPSPFRWIEIQTSGISINKESLNWLRSSGVTTISLSLSNMFDDAKNYEYNGTQEKYRFQSFINDTCGIIKSYDFALRLSLNMTDAYNSYVPEQLFKRIQDLEADQVTFRVLYSSGLDTEEDKWIKIHKTKPLNIAALREYIIKEGHKLETLPFGAMRYSVEGISTVVDNDCMSMEIKNTIRYLILRPNCKLYTKWDDSGSLLF